MSSLNSILYTDSWIPYNDTLFHSRLVLNYPKNLIFTTQLLSRVQSLSVYQDYPDAERFAIQSLQSIDWEKSLIVFNRDSHVVMAPEPVLKLIQLDRRLNYREAADTIFGPFQILPFQWFHSQWIWMVCLLLGWIILTFLSTLVQRMPYQLVVSSKVSNRSIRPR